MSISAGALFGNALTDKQLAMISAGACEEVILYPDPDAPGIAGFIKIAERLRESWKGTVKVAWPVELPADEADLRDVRGAVESAKTYSWELGVRMRLGS